MPFNGSGVFTITTAGFPAVPATTSDFILNIKRRW